MKTQSNILHFLFTIYVNEDRKTLNENSLWVEKWQMWIFHLVSHLFLEEDEGQVSLKIWKQNVSIDLWIALKMC